MPSKKVKLKCGHTVDTKGFKPVNDGRKWSLEGYEPDCDRIIKVSITNAQPSVRTMEKWMDTGIAKAVDGCKVEPDGTCRHGAPSWILAIGLI